jgi:magnesium transporter
MLKMYLHRDGVLVESDAMLDKSSLASAPWIDLLEPTKEEEHEVEALLGIDIPSREDMQGVESSSQLYHEGNATVMTLRVLRVSDRPAPALIPITFILTPERLVTLRYGESTAFLISAARASKEAGAFSCADAVITGLIEAMVDRLAEILEGIGDELDRISTNLFTQSDEISHGMATADLNSVLKAIGRNGDISSRTRECLYSISRIMPVLEREQATRPDEEITKRLSTAHKDVKSLLDHIGFLSGKVQLLLDSALGLINIQQNAIIKIFSVAAVIFMPPTLVASVYGMNFEHMPELKWLFGYPYALGMMVLSALVPFWYFKHRKWL